MADLLKNKTFDTPQIGHSLGCTGTKLSVHLFNEMRRRKQKYGLVTMCVGTWQGEASVFELLN